jgi:C1A family cysteine protease
MRQPGTTFGGDRGRPISHRARRLGSFALPNAGLSRAFAACFAAVAAFGFLASSGAAQPLSPGDTSPRTSARSAPAPRVAPLSAAFRRYLEGRIPSGARAARGQRAGGLVPSPIDFSYLSGTPVEVGLGAALPPTYDLRRFGKLGPVDDQGSNGTCWAFAALDSLESGLMPADPQDFSEDNLVLASGFDGDPYQTGGSALEATAYLARWGGPVTAAEDAYGDASTPRGAIPVKHVQDVLFLPPRSGPLDNAAMKQAVMTYGATYTVMYIGSLDPAHFNDTTDAYYYWGDAPFDHAVTVVGWDDSYGRGNFAVEPPGDGAFLVRNTWGASFGRGGYFYVSYYDSCIGSRLGAPGTTKVNNDVNAVFTGAEPAGNFGDVYQYDPLGWTDSLGFGSDTAWCAATYTARSSDPLAAVSFYTAAPDSSYELYASTGGAAQLSLLQAGGEPLPGYHTIALAAPVRLATGQAFTVAVKLVTPGYAFPVPLETSIDGYSSGANAAPGQTYVSADGETWTDVTTLPDQQGTSVCLKAFTRAEGPVDLTSAVTAVSGASSAWRHTPLALAFSATDGADGSGVAFTQSKIGADEWKVGGQTVVAAPKTHVNDGVLLVLFRSIDKARPCSVRRGTYATLRFRLFDAQPSRGACRAVVKVRSLSGHLRLTLTPRDWYASGTLGRCRFLSPRSLTRGMFRVSVTALDGAGNTSVKAATSYLTVR